MFYDFAEFLVVYEVANSFLFTLSGFFGDFVGHPAVKEFSNESLRFRPADGELPQYRSHRFIVPRWPLIVYFLSP